MASAFLSPLKKIEDILIDTFNGAAVSAKEIVR
jgi:hypothetical protein